MLLVACGETDTQQSGNDVNYTISFETNGGSPVANLVVDGKSEITIPQTTKEGYFFAGWFVDNGTFNVRFNLAYITANSTKTSITVYAKWSVEEVVEQTYTVAFETNGGSAVGNIVIAAGNTIKLPTAPTKTEYSFVGWFVDNNTFQIPFDLDYIKANPTLTSITLYAKWKINSYTVTFETSGGSTIASQKIDYNGFANKPTAPNKVGYSFDGWYKEASFATGFNFATEKITANTTIYAKWKINSYTVAFETSGGSAIVNQTIDYNGFAKAPIAPTKVGYSFDGWYKEASFATGFNFATEKITANTTIYAKWKIDSYTVTFETNGGSTIVNQTIDYNCFATAPTAPTKVGYSFDGWCKDESLITPFAFATEKITANTTIYAKWKIDSYTVTFETNGGSTIASQTIDYNSFATTPTAPTKAGYFFDGWYKEASFVTAFNFKTEKITAKIIIYAKWVAVDDCLTFTFTDSSNSAYSVTQKSGATLPNSIDLPAEYNSKPVVDIGRYAFSSCRSLTSVTIPAGVTSIGESAFAWCSSLASITVASGNTKYKSIDGNLYSKDGSTLFQYAIGKTATSFTIPSGVISIGNSAFSYCGRLTSVTIPSSVTSTGSSAFSCCRSLTSVTFEAGSKLSSIGDGAFSFCSSLIIYAEVASKPAGWDSNWNYSFCPVVWDSTNNNIASDGNIYAVLEGIRYSLRDGKATVVRQLNSITTANIPVSVTFNNLTYNVTSIGTYAFRGCSSLTSVTIPASVTVMGYYAFSGCSRLTSITVESGNTKYKSIDGNLYSKDGSTLLQYAIGKTDTSFTIPSSVTSIDDRAFSGCSSLTSVTIPSSVTSIGSYAFEDCSSLTIYAEATSQPSGWSDNWKDDCYATVVWGHNNITTNSDYDYVIHNNEVYLTKYKGSNLDIVIPATIDGKAVVSLGSTFSGNTTIKSVQIPSSVTSIGNDAFSGCSSLASFAIPAGVTSIGNSAFSGCSSLTSVTIPSSVTSIGYEAFSACSSLTIYAEVASQPSGWNSNWNYDNLPVVWGYTGA